MFKHDPGDTTLDDVEDAIEDWSDEILGSLRVTTPAAGAVTGAGGGGV